MLSLYQKLDDNEIRVLAVQTGTDTEPPRYTFKHIILGGTAQYETLSYLHAGSSKTGILVDEHQVEVPESCKLALEELGRKEAGDDVFQIWIPEICINHEDPAETQYHAVNIHRISAGAQTHNIWHSLEPGSCDGESNKASGIVQFKDEELTSPKCWKEYFQNSNDQHRWSKVVSFFANGHDNGTTRALNNETRPQPRSIGKTIASLCMSVPAPESTDEIVPLDSSFETTRSLLASMADHSRRATFDPKLILYEQLELAAILGLGTYFKEASLVTSPTGTDVVLKSDESDSQQDAVTLECLDTSYQHFIVPHTSLNTTPLNLVPAGIQEHRGFKLHLEQRVITIEIPKANDKHSDTGSDTNSNTSRTTSRTPSKTSSRASSRSSSKASRKATGSDENNGTDGDKGGDEDGEKKGSKEGSENDSLAEAAALAEALALPEVTSDELAFLENVDLEKIDDSSPSRLEWMRIKRENGEHNEFMDRLMALKDLEDFKKHCLKIKFTIETLQRQGADLTDQCFNVGFIGQPETCKPVIRLYAHFLMSINAVPGDDFIETTVAQHTKDNDVSSHSSYSSSCSCCTPVYGLTEISSYESGVFYLKDADLFEREDSRKEYVRNLRKTMAGKRGKFIFLYSCSTVDKMDSFLDHRYLKEEIPHTIDLDGVPEHDIFKSMLRDLLTEKFKKKMEIEGGLDGVYCRIIERQVDGGNRKFKEKSLNKAFSTIYRRQFDRVVEERQNGKNPDECLITKEDIVGPRPGDALDASKAWKEMMEMIGMDSVKASLRSFASLARLNHERKLHDLPPLRTALNRVFLGPPGTGKTTVAKLYGQILADLGMLSDGGMIFKKASDLIGQYVGQSEEYVKSALEKAQGKVLVIDEAYMLYPGKRSGDRPGGDVFRVAVIDTLVAEIQNVPGEDLCVILIGYTEPMKEMLQCANPGLARRFPIDDAFEFEKFSMEQLARVLELKIDRQKLELTEKAKEVALRVLETARDRPNFGNGGEVDNLLSRAIINQQRRISDDSSVDIFTAMKLQPEDFDPDFDRHSDYEARSKEIFKDFVGREDIIAKFDGYQKTFQGMRLHGINPRSHDLIPLNFLFKGPPGTGKTTMARKIGQIFYNMGYLSSSEVVECSVSDLIGQYVGHTGPKVIALLERALGKVLFVDEAYRLAEGRFASEAVEELIDCVTKERFANKLVIILAGYAENMDKLKNINPGFASRFATEIVFEHLSPEHCLMLLQRFIGEFGIRIEGVERDTLEGKIRDKIHKSLCRLFADLMETPSWGNGRDVKTLARLVVHRVFGSCSTVGGNLTISSLEVQAILQQMLVDKRREAQAMVQQNWVDNRQELY